MTLKTKKKIRYAKSPIKPVEKKDRLVFAQAWLKGRRNPRRSWHIKLGDEVIILSGKDKGKTGKVTQVFPLEGKVTVEGINIRKIHRKLPGQESGEIFEKTGKLFISKVSLFVKDGEKIKPTRIRYNEQGKRVAVKGGQIFD